VARRTTLAYAALATADTLLAATGRDRQRWLTKPLLMPVLMAGRDRPAQRALALGASGTWPCWAAVRPHSWRG
jgi:hypothetical protein